MRIKTQFFIILILFSTILSLIAVSVAITEQQVAYLNVQQEISSRIERGASGLNSILVDYFLYQEDLQVSRWDTTLSSLSSDLANIEESSAELQMLADTVAIDLQNLNTQFNDLATYLQSTPRNASVRTNPAFQIRWSTMAVQSQALASDASQLSQSIIDQAHQINTTNVLLILLLVGAFGAFLATIYFMVFRRTLKSVVKLQNGIDTIGSGNLDYKINVEGQNEITQLSRAFNQMTANLKTVTASKADLEKEIEERKTAQEALRERNKELEQLQIRLEEKAAEVEEYASRMEELATERARRLQDAERLAAIGATAGMVGHDIRNPLQAIIGDLYLLDDEIQQIPNAESRKSALETVNAINQNVGYINKIVSDLQAYARKTDPIIEDVDLQEAVDTTLKTINIPSNIQVNCQIPRYAKLKADSAFIRRILTNLTTNAIQAMPDGGILTINVMQQTNGFVQITVADTGKGIPTEVKDKLFTPLFTTKSKGQGFGLAVVKKFVEQLGGTIVFESEVDKGTSFIVRLPRGNGKFY